MTEYMAQMKKNGKWLAAHAPNNGGAYIKPDRKKVEDMLEWIMYRWEEYGAQNKRLGLYDPKYYPTEFRIVSREVTEWTEVRYDI